MNLSKLHNLLAAAAALLAGAWVIAWLADLLTPAETWVARPGLFLAGLGVAGGGLALTADRSRRNRRAAEQFVEAHCRLDPHDVQNDAARERIPPLPPSNPWRRLADSVRDTLVERARQVQDLEHARTALEIRSARASTRYEQIKAILSGLDEPVLAIDDYDELLLANRRAQELLQFDADDPQTRAFAELVHCQELVGLLSGMAHRKGGGARSCELEIPTADGGRRWYRVAASKLAQADDRDTAEPVGGGAVVAVLHDIAEQRGLQKRNAEFVSAVSHEMKTPLAGIKAYVELLVDGDAEDEATREEFLNVITGQADRLQRLIDNLLNLARIEAGVVQVSKKPRSLNELLEEAVNIVRPSADAKHIELAADLSPMYLGVLADRDMLLQAAINLLSNAIKYTPQQGRVTVRSRLEEDHVRFEVQDTGVGLGPEDCQRVFEKFYRVKKNKDMASGTGLGLPLAKHIVEDVHGGRLTVESTLGQGSTFAVVLPSAAQLS